VSCSIQHQRWPSARSQIFIHIMWSVSVYKFVLKEGRKEADTREKGSIEEKERKEEE
jgi:hypothetical protein